MEEVIVLYPCTGIGHLISMVELGRLILKHDPSFSIKILITTPPYNTGSTTPYINRVSTTTPSITFHHLPTISLSLDFPNHETLVSELIRLNNPNVHQALQTISQTSNVRALLIDFFCTAALHVATSLNIPCYYFFTTSANGLATLLYFSTIHHNTTESLKDSKTHLQIPGLPPIPASDMPNPVLDRTDKAYEEFLYFSTSLPKSKGIIVNSFESLEPRAIKAISDGLCVPDAPTPPVYYIGPLIAADDQTDGGGGRPKCLTWLDSQPSGSVVFLCFGSLGLFSVEQLKEIAVGLEKSEQRFLWVVRSPPTEDKSKRFLAPPDPDLDALLPEGFLERTRDRGLVVKSWAPQVAVLNHESVGGFVTHCGWNSVLEALCAGVPMVAWPLYAEQRMNRVILVEEMKLVLSMDDPDQDGLVSWDVVEKRVRGLMDSEEGKLVRDRVMAMRDGAKAAMEDSGSARLALAKVVDSWKPR
ncbi:hypothetical protein HHK36_029053 [Tetracentron sinense]|uniref:Glycosyltransferase n=1 Tax=Tetracentron sinense TaxID=13715 RepID=A0A835D0T5_TETSI|nr:hypothetical protein HHK36_029053 [Tetracentron sinense]